MSEIRHPLPWSLGDTAHNRRGVLDANGWMVCDAHIEAADTIVVAVNAHELAIAAMDLALSVLNGDATNNGLAMAGLRAALKKARGLPA